MKKVIQVKSNVDYLIQLSNGDTIPPHEIRSIDISVIDQGIALTLFSKKLEILPDSEPNIYTENFPI